MECISQLQNVFVTDGACAWFPNTQTRRLRFMAITRSKTMLEELKKEIEELHLRFAFMNRAPE